MNIASAARGRGCLVATLFLGLVAGCGHGSPATGANDPTPSMPAFVRVSTETGDVGKVPTGWSVAVYRGSLQEPVFLLIPPKPSAVRVMIRLFPFDIGPKAEDMASWMDYHSGFGPWSLGPRAWVADDPSCQIAQCLSGRDSGGLATAACGVMRSGTLVQATAMGLAFEDAREIGGMEVLHDITVSVEPPERAPPAQQP